MAGLEDEISGSGDVDLVPDLDANLTFEYVGVLVLVLVGMHRRGEDAWLHGMRPVKLRAKYEPKVV